MDLKSLVQTGLQHNPPRIVIHGPGGIGKSTFGAGAPNPIFLTCEDGLSQIDVPHFPLATKLQDVWDQMGLLITEDHEYKTFVLDSVDQFQRLAWENICEDKEVNSIDEIGYGKGYNFAMQHFDKLFAGLDKLREKGMCVLIIAHSEIKIFSPPDGDSYDRYGIKLHKNAAARLEEWSDLVLFADTVIYVDADKKKAVGSGERVLHTACKPAWRTKTRFDLPDTLPLNFGELMKAIKTIKTIK